MQAIRILLGLGVAMLAGCQSVPRRPAPTHLIDQATPVGFSPAVRLLTTDQQGFATRAPVFFRGLRAAATDGSVDILALSGGGSGGAFGAGALVGLTRARQRPQFELVTGVSAGALLAPFAFLGSDWDARMQQAFSGNGTRELLTSPRTTLIMRLLFPMGRRGHNPLFKLVDGFVTPDMINAVARANATGRRLIVATTDLDKQETVLWDMGAIATQGGTQARALFRDVLVASASVPGIFPPVLIHVRDGGHNYDEMHVDGGVTTSVFTMPLIASIDADDLPQLRGANLYMIINGQLAHRPQTTPTHTIDILSAGFSAEMTYKTREAIISNLAAAHRLGMHFHMTEIPADYPQANFIDFDPHAMQALFDFASTCAKRGQLWLTAAQSIQRNMHPLVLGDSTPPVCPLQALATGR